MYRVLVKATRGESELQHGEERRERLRWRDERGETKKRFWWCLGDGVATGPGSFAA